MNLVLLDLPDDTGQVCSRDCSLPALFVVDDVGGRWPVCLEHVPAMLADLFIDQMFAADWPDGEVTRHLAEFARRASPPRYRTPDGGTEPAAVLVVDAKRLWPPPADHEHQWVRDHGSGDAWCDVWGCGAEPPPGTLL